MHHVLLNEMTKYLKLDFCIQTLGCVNKYMNYHIFNALSGRLNIWCEYINNKLLVKKLVKYKILHGDLIEIIEYDYNLDPTLLFYIDDDLGFFEL